MPDDAVVDVPTASREHSGKAERRRCPGNPKRFVVAGHFGWTDGLNVAREDPTFGWREGGQGAIDVRSFECLMGAVVQHVFFARLRVALHRRRWTMRTLIKRLDELDFAGGGGLVVDQI
jgi:hypothetical protein